MSFRTLTVLAAALAAGCSSAIEPSPAPPAAPRIVVVGGDGQEGIPDEALPLPFVVQVADAVGGIPGAEVTWRVQSGSGVFLSPATLRTDSQGEARVRFKPGTHRTIVTASLEGTGATPARFETLPSPVASYALLSPPTACINFCQRYIFYADGSFQLRYAGSGYSGTFSRTDSVLALNFASYPGHGEARAVLRGDSLLVFYNGWMQMADFEDALLVLEAASPIPPWLLHLEMVSGDAQAGEADLDLASRFYARVANAAGVAVRGPRVTWKVVSGPGAIVPGGQDVPHADDQGLTSVLARPTGLGTIAVSVELVDGFAPPIIFHATASCWSAQASVDLWRVGDPNDDGFYLGTRYSPFTLRLGTRVELGNANWVGDGRARFRSASVPAGGAEFDSGPLEPGGTFSFMPNVEGRWVVVDEVSRITGEILVAGVLGEPRCPMP